MDKDKKDKKDKKPAGPNRMVEVLVLVLMIFFVWLVVMRIQQLLVYYGEGTFREIWEEVKDYFLSRIWPILKIIAVVVGALSVVGIFYNKKKLKAIEDAEEIIFGKPAELTTEAESFGHKPTGEAEMKNMKWENVQKLINSTNKSDWRQAIIEADIMLDELLTASQYLGDSIGEKLKSVEPSDFLTLDSAWSAHKVRNRIAHDGASFLLNEREAKITISQFEAVFKEFKVI